MDATEARTSPDERDPGDLAYDGFMSYSHAADDLLAPRLQAGLQRFAKPWWKRRALRIFRDEASLSANPHLWSSIADSLDGSGWFVPLLSPDAASSPWVNREVEYWLSRKDPSRILPVVTAGEFTWAAGDLGQDTTAAPPALYGVFSEEPRWVDLRWASTDTDLDLRNTRFRAAVADIASAIREVPKDELESEEVKQHRRTIRTVWAAGIALVVLVVLATVAAVFALNQREEAQQQTLVAQANEQTALANERLARARELAGVSSAVVGASPQLGILLALQAVGEYEAAGVEVGREAVEALHHSVLASRVRAVWEHGHQSSVAVAYSPDGSLLASGTGGGSVRLLDPATGSELRRLDGHSGAVVDIEWSGDGSRLLTTSPDRTVRIWNVESGEEEARFDCPCVPLRGSLSPDGTRVATTGFVTFFTVGVWVWDAATGATLWNREDLQFPTSVGFDPVNSDRLAIANSAPEQAGGGLILVDASTGADLLTLPTASGECDLKWSPDGARIVTAGRDGATVWDTSIWQVQTRFREHNSFVCAVDLSADGSRAVTGGRDGHARIWELSTGRQLLALSGHTVAVGAVSLSPDGRLVATSSNDGTDRIWDISTAGRQEVLTIGDAGGIFRGEFTPAGDFIALSSGTGTVRLVDALTGQDQVTFPHATEVSAIALNRDGTRIATGGNDGIVRVWSTATGVMEASMTVALDGIALPIRSLAWDPDGETLAIGTQISAHTWRPSANELNLVYRGLILAVKAVAYSPDGGLLAAAVTAVPSCRASCIRFWDTEAPFEQQGEPGLELVVETNTADANSIEFTSDGSRLLTAHSDGVVRLWDLDTRQTLREYRGHQGRVWDASLSPDETTIASVGADRTVRLWDTATGELLLVLRDDPGPTSVSFSPGGKHLMVTGILGAHIYLTDTAELVDLAKTRLIRGFTDQECVTYSIAPCPTLEEITSGTP